MVALDEAGTAKGGFDSALRNVAIALFVGTLFLIFVGGTVTSLEAGMAVPDWPTTFGENMITFPPSKWKGDVFYEHGHRLTGAGIGVISILLALVTQFRERRAWVRRFAWGLLLAVIAQGVMGGLRVTERSVTLAIVHGCFGQLFLSASCCMVLVTSRSWWSVGLGDGREGGVGRGLVWLAVMNAGLVLAQLIAGALYRHTGSGLMYHVIGAVVTTISVCALVMCVSGEQHDKPMLVRLAGLLGGLFVAQLMLGVGAYVFSMSRTKPTNAWEWVVPSTHVVVGAAVLATSVAVAVAVIRFMGPASVRDESAAVGAAA